MYNENENNDLGRMTPEEHKEEPVTTNFTMRDPDPEETKHESGYEKKDSGNEPGAEHESGYEFQSDSEPAALQNCTADGTEPVPGRSERLSGQSERPEPECIPFRLWLSAGVTQSAALWRTAGNSALPGTPVSENGTGICSGRTKAAEEEIRLC